MASTLVELSNAVPGVSEASSLTQMQPTPPPPSDFVGPKRGDELIQRATALMTPKEDDIAAVKLFDGSKQIIQAKMDQDPEYANKLLGEMQSLKGRQLTDKIVDAADHLKIEYLKQSEPELFQGKDAAVSSFLNSATFGQLSRIEGLVGSMIGDRPAAEIVAEQAEKIRLLEKAYPGWSMAGKVAAFMVPGSPAKKLFEKAAAGGAALVGKTLARFAANPNAMTRTLQAMVGAGAGTAAVAGAQGAAGVDNQDFGHLDRAAGDAGAGLLSGALTAGLIHGGGETIGAVARGGAKMIARTVEDASGASADAYRAYNANPKAIRSAAGTEADLGQEMTDLLLSQKRSSLPEVVQANQLLDDMPPVPVSRVIGYLRSFRKTLDSKKDADVSLLHEWADRIEAKLPQVESVSTKEVPTSLVDASGKAITRTESVTKRVPVTRVNPDAQIPASLARDIVDEMQIAASNYYQKESPLAGSGLKTAARRLRLEISGMASRAAQEGKAVGATEEAIELGQKGEAYNDLMAKAAEKRGVMGFFLKAMGRHPEAIERNSERFFSNLFGANKTLQHARMKALDTKLGTNFYERAQNAHYAKQFGPDGTPGLLPRQFTGASVKGTILGAAVGGATGFALGDDEKGKYAGLAAGALVSSPALARHVIGASDKISGWVQAAVNNPNVLTRVASDPRNNHIVRQAAKHMVDAIQKDGPQSAGSVARIIADTPFFIGLVHAWDLASEDLKSRRRQTALERTGDGQ